VRRFLAVAAAVALSATPAVAAYEAVAVTDGGTLSGVVRFVGTPSKLEPLVVARDRETCGAQQSSEALVRGLNRGVRGSVVLIEGITRGKKATGEVLLDSQRCLFVSHVSALAVGDRVRVKSSDATVHNVRGFMGTATVFNLALPTRDQLVDVTRRLTKPGVVRVVCDAHPHMFAWLVVHDSPYVAVTDDAGAFQIADVPPQTYRVTVWHEGFRSRGAGKDGRPRYDEPRTITKQVTVAPRGAATVQFELK
jgi:plastocyanin